MAKVDVKVVLLGAAAVGKTCLVERYLNRRFVEEPQATIGAAFTAKKITIDGSTITLGIWDTAGSERYESMSRIYYRSAKAAIICYDCTRKESFARVQFWADELKANEEGCRLYIVGCKADRAETADAAECVSSQTAKNYAEQVSGKSFETSSVTGKNIDELFYSIAEDYVHGPQYKLDMNNSGNSDSNDTVSISGKNDRGGGGGGCAC